MQNQDLLDVFRGQVERARSINRDETTFYCLSKYAVQVYLSHPQLGEEIARQMTDLWYHNHPNWQDTEAETLGQLFADLDVPPHHVAGGKAGAERKWQMIQELLNDGGRMERPPDRRTLD